MAYSGWYLYDSVTIVEKESKRPCSRLYDKDVKKLLFKVTYYEKRPALYLYDKIIIWNKKCKKYYQNLIPNKNYPY